jgi:hypothetical protein
MTQPIFLPNIELKMLSGEETICTAGFASLVCNVATGRLDGDQPNCQAMLLGLAERFERKGFAIVLKAAETDDQAMGALLRETKVLIQLAAESQNP